MTALARGSRLVVAISVIALSACSTPPDREQKPAAAQPSSVAEPTRPASPGAPKPEVEETRTPPPAAVQKKEPTAAKAASSPKGESKETNIKPPAPPTQPREASSNEQRPGEAAPSAPQENSTPAVAGTPATPNQPLPPPAPAVPATRRVTIPAGTAVAVRTIDALNSETDQAGQTYRAAIDTDILVDGTVVLARRADAILKLVQVSSAGEVRGKSELRVQLDRVTVNGRNYGVSTSDIIRSAEPEGAKTTRDIAIGAVIGTAIGAIAGGGKGAGVGAAAGAGTGAAAAIMTKGEQVRIQSETRLDFRLDRSLEVEIPNAPTATSTTRPSASGEGPRRLSENPAGTSPREPSRTTRDERDLSGEWDLTIDLMEGSQGRRTVTLFLDQRGRQLTGYVEGGGRQRSTLRGSVDGDSVTFSVTTDQFDRSLRQNFTGTISGNRMRGNVTITAAPEIQSPRGRRGGRVPGIGNNQRGTWTARRVEP